MNPEKMQIKGQLAESKKKIHNLRTEAAGYVILVRSLLNPYEDDISKLEIEKVASVTQRLEQLINEIRELKEKIKKLESWFD